LDALYDENINHNDLHSNNFLYSISNGDIEFKIIDFDTAFPLTLVGDRNYKIENIGPSEPSMIDVSTPVGEIEKNPNNL
jgi:Ser/Thr protein kinase RdoA (MazF antagonist)